MDRLCLKCLLLCYEGNLCDCCKSVAYPVTDFADRVEPDTEKLKARIFELERILTVIHEHSKI